MNENGVPSIQRFRHTERFLFFAIAFWTLVLSLWIYQYSIRNGGLECWDGYERCAWGANIWYDLRHMDFRLFWIHTNHQLVWPFLHSWITGILFLILGPTLSAARLICLLSFTGSALLILRWFSRRTDSVSIISAVVAWGLFTTSPAVLQHSVSIMSELPGLLMILAVLFLIPEPSESDTRKALAAGVILGFLFLYKYNFAFLTYFSLTVSMIFRERFSLIRLFRKSNVLILGTPVLLLLLWMLPHFSAKFSGLIEFVKNNPTVRTPFFFTGLFYYPRIIPSLYFANPYFAVVGIAVVAAAYPYAKRISLRDPLTVGFAVHFLATVLHPMKDPRFIFISMGLLYLIIGEAVGVMIDRLLPRIYRWHDSSWRWAALALFAAVAVYQYPVFRIPWASQKQFHLAPIQTIVDLIAPTDRVAFLVTHDPICPPMISYHLTTALDRCQSQENNSPPDWTYFFLFETGEQVRALSLEERMRRLRYFLDYFQSNKIITIQSTAPEGIPRFDVLFGGTQIYSDFVSDLHDFMQVFEKEFQQMKVKIRVFDKR